MLELMSSFLTIQYFPTEKKIFSQWTFVQEMFDFEAILIHFLNPGEVSHFKWVPKFKGFFYVAVQNVSVPYTASRKRIKITSPLSPNKTQVFEHGHYAIWKTFVKRCLKYSQFGKILSHSILKKCIANGPKLPLNFINASHKWRPQMSRNHLQRGESRSALFWPGLAGNKWGI